MFGECQKLKVNFNKKKSLTIIIEMIFQLEAILSSIIDIKMKKNVCDNGKIFNFYLPSPLLLWNFSPFFRNLLSPRIFHNPKTLSTEATININESNFR